MSNLAGHFKRVREALLTLRGLGMWNRSASVVVEADEAGDSLRAIGEAQHHTSDCAAARWCSKDCDCPRAEILEVLK